MSRIKITNLTFAYEGTYQPIFEKVNFIMDTDWKLGFTGRNGRGKTTFMKLLTGDLDAKGAIRADVSFEYFPYEVQHMDQTSIEIIEKIAPRAAYWEIQREVSLLKMNEDILYRPFKTLSFGERTKLMLAGMFLKENAFLLIDEPTNHLDYEGRQILSAYLNRKKGFILISHDRQFLDSCIDHILAINKTNIDIQKGNFSSWWHNKELQDQFEFAENEKLKRDVVRLTKSARQVGNWSDAVERSRYGSLNSGCKIDRGYVGRKSAKMMKRSKQIEKRRNKAIDDKKKLLKNIENQDQLKLIDIDFRTEQMMYAENLSLSYGEKVVFDKVSFKIQKGQQTALVGKNGSGKTSLLKLIIGEDIPYRGSFSCQSNLKISYVSQDTSDLMGSITAFSREHDLEDAVFKAMLNKLDIPTSHFEKPMETFSSGQKKKILIAKSLSERAHLYIWDEPFNYVDVFSRIQIENLILEQRPTLIFVEHDHAFSEKIATSYIELI